MNRIAECRICGSDARYVFSKTVLKNLDIAYFRCPVCDFVQTERPTWLGAAYASPINIEDTGLLARNWRYSQLVGRLIANYYSPSGRFVDYAGGYGIFVRLMRDIGFDFYWFDPYVENVFARGFEYCPDAARAGVELVTCIECFEHFVDPVVEIEKVLGISTEVFFTTELHTRAADLSDWWYLGTEHGQHVSFYSQRTLRHVAKRLGVELYTDGRANHLFSRANRSDTQLSVWDRLLKRITRFPWMGRAVRRYLAGSRRLEFSDVVSGSFGSLADYHLPIKSKTVEDMRFVSGQR